MNETIATGLRQPGGPVALTDGRVALVEMDDSRRCLTVIAANGARQEIGRAGGRPSGPVAAPVGWRSTAMIVSGLPAVRKILSFVFLPKAGPCR